MTVFFTNDNKVESNFECTLYTHTHTQTSIYTIVLSIFHYETHMQRQLIDQLFKSFISIFNIICIKFQRNIITATIRIIYMLKDTVRYKKQNHLIR